MRHPSRPVRLFGGLVVVMLVAPWLAPYAPEAQLDLVAQRGLPPSWTHWLGTDLYARDVLSRVLAGTRVTLAVALGSVVLSMGVATVVGTAITLAPRPVSTLLAGLVEALLPVPRLLLLLACSAALTPLSGAGLTILIGLTGWVAAARLVADETRRINRSDFVLAARAIGLSEWRIMRRHLWPHLQPVLTAHATLAVAAAISAEAGLGFLGLGIAPPAPSWGNIMRDGAGVVTTQWWLTVAPAVAATLAMLACHQVGEAFEESVLMVPR